MCECVSGLGEAIPPAHLFIKQNLFYIKVFNGITSNYYFNTVLCLDMYLLLDW